MDSSTERKCDFRTRSSWPSSLGAASTSSPQCLRLSTIVEGWARSWPTRLRTIFRATKTHALNLAKFVSLYKALVLIQRRANGGKERGLDTFLAGMLGGYVVFGDRTAINEQVRCNFHLRPNDKYRRIERFPR